MKSLDSVILAAALFATGCASHNDRLAKNGENPANDEMRQPTQAANVSATSGAGDSFLWLENTADPKVKDWAKQQSSRTSAALEGDGRFSEVQAQTFAIVDAKDRIPGVAMHSGKLRDFWTDANHPRGIWRQTTPESFRKTNPSWDVLLDVDALNKQENKSFVFEKALCLEPESNLCLITLSDGGRDEAEVREFNVSQKAFVKNGFNIPAAKTDIYWVDANTVLVGTDFGPGTLTTSGYPRQVKFLKRGQPLSAATLVYEGAVTDMSVGATPTSRPESNTIYVSRAIDFFHSENSLLGKDGKLTRLPFPTDANFIGEFKGQLLAVLRSDLTADGKTFATGTLVSLPLARAFASNALKNLEVVFEPSAQSVFDSATMTKDHLLVSVLNDVSGELWSYSPSKAGWKKSKIKIPAAGTITVEQVDEFDPSNRFYVLYASFLTPPSLYAGAVGAKKSPALVKQLSPQFDSSDMVTEQLFSTSQDGTKVPYFIVHKKDYKLDGQNPTYLTAYGGFELPMTPAYLGSLGKAWAEKGGVFVLANIRGGGEFGPKWHTAAIKDHRQLAYQDFASVAKDLEDRKITSPRRLAIQGGSNGGLLMGVAETQHPDYYQAVICESGLLDMLRYTKLPPGASWIGEYGDPDDPTMAAYIATYSPYQNVRANVKYPATFFHVSTADDRVQPGHSRKMAAKMEQDGNNVFFFENTEGGHGGTADNAQLARKSAMKYIFLYQQVMD